MCVCSAFFYRCVTLIEFDTDYAHAHAHEHIANLLRRTIKCIVYVVMMWMWRLFCFYFNFFFVVVCFCCRHNSCCLFSTIHAFSHIHKAHAAALAIFAYWLLRHCRQLPQLPVNITVTAADPCLRAPQLARLKSIISPAIDCYEAFLLEWQICCRDWGSGSTTTTLRLFCMLRRVHRQQKRVRVLSLLFASCQLTRLLVKTLAIWCKYVMIYVCVCGIFHVSVCVCVCVDLCICRIKMESDLSGFSK